MSHFETPNQPSTFIKKLSSHFYKKQQSSGRINYSYICVWCLAFVDIFLKPSKPLNLEDDTTMMFKER